MDNQIKYLPKIVTFPVLILFIFSCTPVVKPVQEKPEQMLRGTHYLWVFKSTVNMRTQAGANSAILTQLADGDSALVLENKNGWYYIQLPAGTTGYIRSDLLAPKEFSIFPRAVNFTDSLRENNIEIYFDKQDQHKQIYLRYPAAWYNIPATINTNTRQILQAYQHNVYAGTVTAIVLKPDSKEIFQKKILNGYPNGDLELPVIPFGILTKAVRKLPESIVLFINIPEGVEDYKFLPAARAMAAIYPLPYIHVEFRFLTNNGFCRFRFIEDESGEHYQYDHSL